MHDKFKSKSFYYRLFGEYALFTDPVTKGGGEKYSYQIPTYQAIKGITEQIYWKPTLVYFIDAVKVIKKIQTETKGIRTPLKDGSNDLNYYTYLRDVEYLVQFHFEWNYNRMDLVADRDETKHEQILLRSLSKGGRRDIFLGTRECVGYIDSITEEEFRSSTSYYDGDKISFGIMFHSFLYPDEAMVSNERPVLVSNFTNIVMTNGTIDFNRPEECENQHVLRDYTYKTFTNENVRFAEEECQLVDEEVEGWVY